MNEEHKECLPDYRQFDGLKGVGIWISEAARKYQVPRPTISRWKSNGYIKIVGLDYDKVLLDEQDVAYCALVYNRNRGQGKRVFNKDGTPYTPRRKTINR